MKQMNILTPEYDIGEAVAFLENGRVTKGVVKSVTQSHGDKANIFYAVACPNVMDVVLPEKSLLFAEVSYAKPLFSIGMKIRDGNNTEGIIMNISIEIDENVYTILYTTTEGEMIDEDDIVEVLSGT